MGMVPLRTPIHCSAPFYTLKGNMIAYSYTTSGTGSCALYSNCDSLRRRHWTPELGPTLGISREHSPNHMENKVLEPLYSQPIQQTHCNCPYDKF